eukprot:scaffold192100_cov34-Attheya_sp.AAC.4
MDADHSHMPRRSYFSCGCEQKYTLYHSKPLTAKPHHSSSVCIAFDALIPGQCTPKIRPCTMTQKHSGFLSACSCGRGRIPTWVAMAAIHIIIGHPQYTVRGGA